MAEPQNIVVTYESTDESRAREARALASRLSLPFIAPDALRQVATDQLVLAIRDDGLELRDSQTRPGRGVMVDFTSLHPGEGRKRSGLSRNQPLGRAMGRATKTVLDATAGLGQDSALLACMGFTVVGVERSPVLFELLRDGFNRAVQAAELHEAIGDRLRFINADARDVLRVRASLPLTSIDAAYIDPMFPPKRRSSALAKKEIRLVRQIVGDDEDAADLLQTAREHVRRVIVKRPHYAPPLASNPTAQITTNLVRYDIYVQPNLKSGSGC